MDNIEGSALYQSTPGTCSEVWLDPNYTADSYLVRFPTLYLILVTEDNILSCASCQILPNSTRLSSSGQEERKNNHKIFQRQRLLVNIKN